MNESERIKLNARFKPFTSNVYFQPPSSVTLIYPCIVYKKEPIEGVHANNLYYKMRRPYQVTVIDRDPDSTIAEDILESFKYCNMISEFTADNLNHTVLRLYTNI